MDQLLEKLIAETKIQGVISFARFMELALYCPVYGYYEKEGDTTGRKGDFFTSVCVGNLFGKLLAAQFAQWLSEVQSPTTTVHGPQSGSVQLIEAGAHKGELAKDILRWFRESRPELFERLEYWIIEPSDNRQQWQKGFLAEFTNNVKWAKSLSELAAILHEPERKISPHRDPLPQEKEQREIEGAFREPSAQNSPSPPLAAPISNPGSEPLLAPESTPARRIVFCNELLDAMPIHRWGWDAKRKTWFEWGVSLDGERFVWTPMPPQSGAMEKPAVTLRTPHSLGESAVYDINSQFSPFLSPAGEPPNFCSLPAPLLDVLPDGFTLETSPAAAVWWHQAARFLGCGKLVAIDYGLTQEELIAPERPKGTLRAYRRHRISPDALADPGQQDLTAHVNFKSIQQAGESAGLKTEAFVTQAQFLTSIAARIWNGEFAFERWTPNHTRQFQTLTSPEHLGRAFRVLIQSR